eukprot:CAMPEP_0118819128 /NCGR_PEP_ID=MMETSP1162-20130426/6698_1 /TAXON_ID=33656 /ORGANISM="Phaeocystis Sp, Strain CCMP2710" /LENGTH=318 /DNA_ID=CAMNT_0006749383 /DNA_START=91 /DNA_END=1047 /DNA_ORIENTATION=-
MSEHLLDTQHAEQLVEYLRFLRRKRDQCVSEIAAEFKELLQSRLLEDQYTREDVEALINGLLAVVRTTVKKDLQFTSSSSILLLKQVLEQVEKAGLTVNADLSATEDLNLLAGVQAWEQTVQGSGVAPQLKLRAGVPKLQGLLTKALPTLGPPVSDPKVIEELQAQKLANEELTVKFQKLQVQCTQILREKSEVTAQLEAARTAPESREDPAVLKATILSLEADLAAERAAAAQVAAASQGPQQGSGVEALMVELRDAQARIQELSMQVEDAQAELSAKLEKTKQFLSMRTLLTKKNVVVRQLREQLKENGIAPAGDD